MHFIPAKTHILHLSWYASSNTYKQLTEVIMEVLIMIIGYSLIGALIGIAFVALLGA